MLLRICVRGHEAAAPSATGAARAARVRGAGDGGVVECGEAKRAARKEARRGARAQEAGRSADSGEKSDARDQPSVRDAS